MSDSQFSASERIYSVSELNREAKLMLEHGMPGILLEGEISNLAKPRSGHWYFNLKDERAQIRAAMFRQANRLCRTPPAEGDKVQVKGKLTLYEARGDYQLIVERISPAGEGALRQAYEQLRHKLEQEGLFSAERKQQLPTWPQKIGVITSATGAALQDILHVLARRCAAIEVVVYPSLVQGDKAPAALLKALQTASDRNEVDVLILGRGGGSLEDLWAFNDENLVRAIADCRIPIISAVGHETDFSLSDFVADLRAPTPSVAAELVSPDSTDWLDWLNAVNKQLRLNLNKQLQALAQKTDDLQLRLERQHPLKKLQPYRDQLHYQRRSLQRALPQLIQAKSQQLQPLQLRLHAQSPTAVLAPLHDKQLRLSTRLQQSGKALTQNAEQQLKQLSLTLQAVSPLATLNRGYAIASLNGKTITQADQAKSGDRITLTLAKGQLETTVD